jgi:hypothetical protein
MKIGTTMLVLVSLVSIGTLVCGCSSLSQPSIVGQWKARAMSDDDVPAAMEVFKNGTVVIQVRGDFHPGIYEPKDNTIVVGDEPMSVAVLTKSTIVLTDQDGDDAFVFDRVDD